MLDRQSIKLCSVGACVAVKHLPVTRGVVAIATRSMHGTAERFGIQPKRQAHVVHGEGIEGEHLLITERGHEVCKL